MIASDVSGSEACGAEEPCEGERFHRSPLRFLAPIEVCEDGARFAAFAVAADDGRQAGIGEGATLAAAVRQAVDAALRAKPPARRQWEGADDDSRAAWAIEPKKGEVKRAREQRRLASGAEPISAAP